MRYLIVLFTLFAFLVPLSAGEFSWTDTVAFSWDDTQAIPQSAGCNCAETGICTCGVNCDCVGCSWKVAYWKADELRKPILLGLDNTPPASVGWMALKAATNPLPVAVARGETVLLRTEGKVFYITKRFQDQVDPFAVANAIKADQQPPAQFQQPVYYQNGNGGGCAGGNGNGFVSYNGGSSGVYAGFGRLLGGGRILGGGTMVCGPGGCSIR